MHANKATNSAAKSLHQQEDSIDQNLTYDLYEGHHKTMMGSMNSSETAANSAASREDSIAPNLTYDLAEGHDKSLKGSMNNSVQNFPRNYDAVLLALHQNDQLQSIGKANQQQLDTNVMYDPLSGEGLVCVNGRCISNKRKFQVHDEKHMGLRGGNRRQRKGPAKRRKRIPRHNGIPMNPYENVDAEDEQDQDDESSEEDPDLVPFED